VVRTIEETRIYAIRQRAFSLRGAEGGNSEVEVLLEDLATGRVARRGQPIAPSVHETARMWPIRLVDDEGPVLTLHVTPNARDLFATTTVVVEEAGCIRWTLASIPTDTTIALAPFLLSPSHGSLTYRGAIYSEADTVASLAVPLDPGPRSPTWPLSGVETGVYRVSAAWVPQCVEASMSPHVSVDRDFLVRPEEYPQLTHLDQLIEALDYIATPEEMAAIRGAADPVARKRMFDAFWGRTGGDRLAASDALGRYYSRVEEANRAYSSFKEGWKTDRGMISIVMGPPLYVEDSIDELRWFYSYDDQYPGRYFVFERSRGQFHSLGFPHYILNRTMNQEREWRLAVQRWRRGTAR